MTLVYDALNRMAEQQSASGNTEIAYGPGGMKLALMNGQTLRKGFGPLPGGGAVVYTPGVLPAYYRHSDWLGSSRLATTPSRTLYFDGAYAPFGEDYNKTGTTDLSFTGQNQDTVSGLYDFLFREYSLVGRWVSPDPAGMAAVHPTTPQTWNRYAYALNNPLSYTDPTGLDCAYANGDGSVDILQGDCASGSDDGYYIDGTIVGGSNGGTVNDDNLSFDLQLEDGSIVPGMIYTGDAPLDTFYAQSTAFPDGVGSVDESSVLGGSPAWDPQVNGFPANNGGWLQNTINFLKSVPWTLTIIASTPAEPIGPAFTMAYNPSTKYLCAGGGLGASVGRNFSVGPLVVGNLQNQNAILSGASISVGAQATPLLGAQAVGNASGILGGPTAGIPGGSATATYSWCGTL